MARRHNGSRAVYVTPEVYDRLHAAAEARMLGVHLLTDRLLTMALDDLPDVDALLRPTANSNGTDSGESAGAPPAGDPESAR